MWFTSNSSLREKKKKIVTVDFIAALQTILEQQITVLNPSDRVTWWCFVSNIYMSFSSKRQLTLGGICGLWTVFPHREEAENVCRKTQWQATVFLRQAYTEKAIHIGCNQMPAIAFHLVRREAAVLEFAPLLVWQRRWEDSGYRCRLQAGRLLNETVHEVIDLAVKLTQQVTLQVLGNRGGHVISHSDA